MPKEWYLLVDEGTGRRTATLDEMKEFACLVTLVDVQDAWIVKPVVVPSPPIVEYDMTWWEY